MQLSKTRVMRFGVTLLKSVDCFVFEFQKKMSNELQCIHHRNYVEADRGSCLGVFLAKLHFFIDNKNNMPIKITEAKQFLDTLDINSY